MTSKPRGIRNNNPLNIEYNKNNQWTGQTGVEVLGRFATFSHMKYGIRAGAKLINNYMTRYGLVTVFDIINRWAPDHENPTNIYADTVAARMGVEVHQPLTHAHIPDLVYEMIKFECGVYVDRALVMEGSRLAGVA
ncbi:structural protein P5 [Vibrio sp. vnigr-6D03]|uniref:structural protein P5 n=1 Tax=Vibrio sp. vnigr-6D03 TaxID=2058088 RepID=UPI000C3242EE|nr:structural protein P5 [Vibrio sp. vnigr-6D03]PKF77327.1 structural protein P5 [Vibrio sp. vnigr-6D03]